MGWLVALRPYIVYEYAGYCTTLTVWRIAAESAEAPSHRPIQPSLWNVPCHPNVQVRCICSGTAAAVSRKPRGAGASQEACRDHSLGRCRYGGNCRYSHAAGAIRKLRGARADREGPRHPKAVRSATASVGLCWNFNSPDGCLCGDACHFAHSNPKPPKNHTGAVGLLASGALEMPKCPELHQ